jgi:hypothetical protein
VDACKSRWSLNRASASARNFAPRIAARAMHNHAQMHTTLKSSLVLALLMLGGLASTSANAEEAAPAEAPAAAEPFAWGDFTWLNGSSRQHSALLDTKYFTGTFTADVNWVYSFNHPVDHTIVGSTATFREGEFNLSFIGAGGDLHWNNVRGRLLLQLGTRATGIARNDPSADRGQFDLRDAYRYISEAYGGYHWDVLHGINLDVGIFMSYVGLFSYNNFENWAYQPSYTSDNTPWFFNGARLQIFPTDRLKVELWLINGSQQAARSTSTGWKSSSPGAEWLRSSRLPTPSPGGRSS